jgi:subtilisin family serine protease
MKRTIVCISVVLLVGVVVLTGRHTAQSPILLGKGASPIATPSPSTITASTRGLSSAVALPASASSAPTTTARPPRQHTLNTSTLAPLLRSRGDALIAQAPVLETRAERQPDGIVIESRLVHLDTKYPDVLATQTVSPDGHVLASQAMAATHLLVRKQPDLSPAVFAAQMRSSGLEVTDAVGPNGVYRVSIPGTPSIERFRQAVAKAQTQGIGSVYAEPDYLVSSHDLGTAVPSKDPTAPARWYQDQDINSEVDKPSVTPPVYSPQARRHPQLASGISVESLPDGARVLTFDRPDLWTGPGYYNPELVEQHMSVSANGGLSVMNATSSVFPNNGTYYIDLPTSATGLTIKHTQGLPFKMVSIDLSEYSTLFASPTSITFTGYKKDGTTVSQTFVTDGIMDGTGPMTDFQTFTFNASFDNLDRVVSNNSTFAFDNVAVIVNGVEAPDQPAPEAPVVYNATFDPPKHTAGQTVAVAGPFAPTTINFGAPKVQTTVGLLTNALSFRAAAGDSNWYQQVSFYLNRLATTYSVDFDTYGDTGISAFLDGTLGFERLDIGGSAISLLIHNGQTNSQSFNLGSYNKNAVVHIRMESDRITHALKIYKDGVLLLQTTALSQGDMKSVRFSANTSTTSNVGIDNVVISASGSQDSSADKPVMYVSRERIDFGSLPVGTNTTLYAVIFNNGYRDLQITNVQSSDSSFIVPFSGSVTVVPGGTLTLIVTFAPQHGGPLTGNITITGNDPALPVYSFPVTGSGICQPMASVTPGVLDVTMLDNTSGTQNLTIGNPGEGTLTWNIVNALTSGSSTGAAVTPADPFFGQLWGLAGSASTGGIDAVHAWNLTTGSSEVIVAVIDSGVDYNHPDLQGNLWTNLKEIAGNGVDDDSNGYKDDVRGYDFQGGTADPMDSLGHGTHVAGTIAAAANNVGVCGVAWHARIMPVKFLGSNGVGYTSDAVNAIDYASRMGAKVANASWGGSGFSQSLSDAIQTAGNRGMLFIASAGNDAQNSDTYPQYPAAYVLPNLISVAACEADGSLAYFSNYGSSSVHLAAPGDGILSLWPNGSYATLAGTSMAAPHVSGVAALVLAYNPSLNTASLAQRLLSSTDSLPALNGKVLTNGHIDAYRAVSATVPAWIHPQITSGTVLVQQSQIAPLTFDTQGLTPGLYTANLTVNTNDTQHSHVLVPINLTVRNSTGLLAWQLARFGSNQMLFNDQEHSLWGVNAAPYGDGINNLLRYATGADVHASSSGVATTGTDEFITMTFVRRRGDSNLALFAETSADLTNWFSDSAHVEIISVTDNLDGTETVKVRSLQPISPGARSFLRLHANY